MAVAVAEADVSSSGKSSKLRHSSGTETKHELDRSPIPLVGLSHQLGGRRRPRQQLLQGSTVTRAFDVGYAKSKQFGAAHARIHIVQKTEGADPVGYRLLCTGTPGTREYRGFIGAVACPKCKEKVNASEV